MRLPCYANDARRAQRAQMAGDGGLAEAGKGIHDFPDGALSSFGATIQAVQALGYRDASRKYLMFADTDVLCGIGTLYNDVRQNGNTNDLRTSYARVDAPCWSGSTHSTFGSNHLTAVSKSRLL